MGTDTQQRTQTRRSFLAAVAGALGALAVPGRGVAGSLPGWTASGSLALRTRGGAVPDRIPRRAGPDPGTHGTRTGNPGPHPDPRPGVDGSRVLPADRVPPHVAELFDAVRRIPRIVDGIRCTCGCADVPGMYSLLSCYEGMGMAQYCDICQGEGRLAVALHDEGLTLDEIRAEVDRRFG